MEGCCLECRLFATVMSVGSSPMDVLPGQHGHATGALRRAGVAEDIVRQRHRHFPMCLAGAFTPRYPQVLVGCRLCSACRPFVAVCHAALCTNWGWGAGMKFPTSTKTKRAAFLIWNGLRSAKTFRAFACGLHAGLKAPGCRGGTFRDCSRCSPAKAAAGPLSSADRAPLHFALSTHRRFVALN